MGPAEPNWHSVVPPKVTNYYYSPIDTWLTRRALTKKFISTLQWRHDECDGVNSQLSRLFTKPCVQAQIKENLKSSASLAFVSVSVTGEFRAQRVSSAEKVSIWWRHHDFSRLTNEVQSFVGIVTTLRILHVYTLNLAQWIFDRCLIYIQWKSEKYMVVRFYNVIYYVMWTFLSNIALGLQTVHPNALGTRNTANGLLN